MIRRPNAFSLLLQSIVVAMFTVVFVPLALLGSVIAVIWLLLAVFVGVLVVILVSSRRWRCFTCRAKRTELVDR
jgi:hypothetical protein